MAPPTSAFDTQAKQYREPLLSGHCLSRRTGGKRKHTLASAQDRPVRVPSVRPLRYDDVATSSVAQAFANAFVEANTGLRASWHQSTLREIAPLVRELFLSYPTTTFSTMRELCEARQCELKIVIMRAPLSNEPEPPNYLLSDLVVWSDFEIEPTTLLPLYRWQVARRKFSLPGRRWVDGPYFAVLAIGRDDPKAPPEVLRGRLWPAAFDEASGRILLVRSALERALAKTCFAMCAPCFTPIQFHQLEILQAGLSHRWRGDITATSKYLPDAILPPFNSELALLLELLGMHSLRHYDLGVDIKHGKIRPGLQQGLYTYREIDLRRLSAEKALMQVEPQMRAIISDHLYPHNLFLEHLAC